MKFDLSVTREDGAEKEATFSKENIKNLSLTCKKINNLLDENVDGAFMATQLMFLADLIQDFKKNPIVKNSGI